MVKQGLELMHLVGVELVRELVGEELVQMTSVNHVIHVQVRHIYMYFFTKY